MAYATQDDLVARFGEKQIKALSDRDNTGAIDTARVDQALADMSNLIDGYLADRYPLPLASVPAQLVPLACDMARYLLAERPTEEIRSRYEDARQWLDKVAQGKYGLGLDASGQQVKSSGLPRAVSARREFTQERLHDFTRPRRVW
jgi:phage gp36-like protein